ncbi:ABC transporter permease [Campylobacter concisus]|uniref:ABC transporter permease n=1 Tax=Campylobacter concisus TaxID=199 RepID=UPI000CD86FA0|nr:ABC transporter permease [Campylobacter concisus]
MMYFILNNYQKLIVIAYMDLKLKYQNSFIGFSWSFIKPLLQFFVYFTVFGVFLQVDTGDGYALRLFFGVLIWTFFSEATSLGLNSFVGKASIINKINVNRLIPPIAAFLTPLFNFCINFIIFIIIYLVSYNSISDFNIFKFFIITVSFLQISILILSLNIILSFLNVFFRDIKQIWEIVLIYGVFLTPIIYKLPIPKEYETLYYCTNLLSFPLENIKYCFFNGYTPILIYDIWLWVLHSAVIVLLFVVSLVIENKLKSKISDFL